VALIIETSNSYARGLLDGITDYIREHEPWSVYLPEQRRGDSPPHWLRRWDGDGIIARIENEAVAACVTGARLPTVDVSAARLLPALPWVETDDAAIAEAGFQHLAERGFRHFAFCGDPSFNWSQWRRQHFERLVREGGHSFHVFEAARQGGQAPTWDRRQQQLGSWVDGLPRPTGVMACYDIMAQQVLDACRSLDVAVPEEIAVVGVDNDELLCRLADPPLSSVSPDTRRTGYDAAALLDRMMRGEPVEAGPNLIRPRGVVTRQSTDVLAISDPHVAEALRFIREHATDGISVGDVLAESRLSRRMLESRFRKIVGRTPHDELVRTRIARVKVLLGETDLSIAQIAERTGYTHIEYLSAQFHRVVGMPPSRYRALHAPNAARKS
jgi:LacI family transcriptional regulator